MKWVAAFLAAIVLAMPLGFADTNAAIQSNTNAEAKAVSVTDLRFKQIGQAFGDFAFHVKSFLTFDENAKIDLLQERNAEMNERQEAWLEVKAEAFEEFEGGLSAEEKQDIEAMIQAEHEAIIKEHLRLTSEIREIQLKAKARGLAQLESEAESAIDSGSGLSLGLAGVSVDGTVNGDTKTRALFIEKIGSAKVHVSGNVALDSETKTAISNLVSNLSADQDVKIEIEVEKEAGANATVEHEANGLTDGQQALLAELEAKAEALVESSASSEARLEIEVRHRGVEWIDTAAEAQAAVEKRLHVDASDVTVETQDGVQVFVVTGTETRTSGSFEMTKSFEVVVEANTGVILSADMTAHFEQITASGQASAGTSAVSGSSSGSASGNSANSGVSSSANAGASSSANVEVSGSTSTSGSASNSSTSGNAAAVGGISIG